MKSQKKRKKHSILFAVLMIVTVLIQVFIGIMFYYFAQLILPLDFSQNYRTVQGVGNIIFIDTWQNQCYKRCFWGLRKTECPQTASDSDTLEDTLYVSDESIEKLKDLAEIEYMLYQSVYSPNHDYILYCEVESDYGGGGVTDDEYCYYKVYEMETGRIIPIFQGYRKGYSLLWTD